MRQSATVVLLALALPAFAAGAASPDTPPEVPSPAAQAETGQGGKLAPGQVRSDAPVYDLPAPASRPAERWRYSLSWSGIPVGAITIDSRTETGAQGRRLLVEASGRTNRLVDLLWRYRLHATGSIALDPFAPERFESEEEERRHRKRTRIVFGPGGAVDARRVKDERAVEYHFDAPNSYDMLSTVFLVLTREYRAGSAYRFDTVTGTSRYLVTVTADAEQTVRVAGKPVPAWKLTVRTHPLTDPDEEGKHRETEVWVSAGPPRRLLRARSRTFIGAIYVNLDAVASIPAP